MRILLIEDEPDLLDAMAQSLREKGYAVDEARDGRMGLYKAEGIDYDAITLDLMLPSISGWDLLSRIRKKKATPVLILTARHAVNDRVRGLDAGADDYLVKPFDLVELEARIRALIRRSAGQPSVVIDVGEIQIDTSARTVTKGGQLVRLTPREYSLLELLTLNRGKLVTRTLIYDHIFDEETDTLSNLVDVHVANLRKKLGRDLISTRRGEGYLVHV
jgi:two-component system, OmpR family, response regulator